MNINFTPAKPEQRMPAPVGLPMALALMALAVALGALAWALVGYLAGRMSLAIAFLVGAGVSLALAYPLRPISTLKAVLLFLPSVASTLASILLGEYLLTVVLVSREFSYPLLPTAVLVAENLEQVLDAPDTAMGLVFGLFGAVLGYLNVVRQGR